MRLPGREVKRLLSPLKIAGAVAVRTLLRVFHVLPVRRRTVMFSAYDGVVFADNPRVVFDELWRRHGPALGYVWCLDDAAAVAAYPGVKVVRRYSPAYFAALLTAQVFITNTRVHVFTPFRASQVVVNTWHGGGAYKRAGTSDPRHDPASAYSMRVANRDYLTWFLSSSEEFSRAISQSNLIPPAKLLPTGMPRNDVFFSGQQQVVAAAARRSLGLDDGTAIVLYAPTYREAGQGFASDLDLGAVARALQARFGRRFTILVRGHWWMKGLAAGLETLDVTDYPHTQDLLCAADVLLTDYSSSIWDFTFTGRPAFLYVPDLEAYEQAPGLETPIATWPYPFATTQAALLQNIADFDEAAHAAKVAQHQAAFGNYETGRATDHVCVLVEAAVSGAEAGRPGLGQQP